MHAKTVSVATSNTTTKVHLCGSPNTCMAERTIKQKLNGSPGIYLSRVKCTHLLASDCKRAGAHGASDILVHYSFAVGYPVNIGCMTALFLDRQGKTGLGQLHPPERYSTSASAKQVLVADIRLAFQLAPTLSAQPSASHASPDQTSSQALVDKQRCLSLVQCCSIPVRMQL